MNTKNILKTLALAMLLVSACDKSEIANDENAEKKGFALPVTVNATRGGDDTKATFNDGTKKLSFSAGDKLLVSGSATAAGSFAGTLTWQSGGTFSGTIYTQNEWENSADALFSSAESIYATLLPAGYDSYNFLSINDKSTSEKYDDEIKVTKENAFVASATAKATGVEQLSLEQATTYSSGFALSPNNAILNFTISGLSAGAQNVALKVYDGDAYSVRGSVTPTSGIATFAMGVPNSTIIRDVAKNLTIGSSNLTLPGGTALAAGKIYNITRSALTYPIALSAVTSGYLGSVVTSDGYVYAKAADATAASKTAVAKITYVGSDTGVDGKSHGLALSLSDVSTANYYWATAISACASKTPTVTNASSWMLPSQAQWNKMITAAGSYTALRSGFSGVGGTNLNSGTYWSSTEHTTAGNAWAYKFDQGKWAGFLKNASSTKYTRACIAF